MHPRVYLKVKIKSLAEEARIIRREECRQKNHEFKGGLEAHRKTVVRPEARATLLAYGFLAGKAYGALEPTAKTNVAWMKVKAMVQKYSEWKGRTELLAEFDTWAKLADEVIAKNKS